jgi:hypothetical protein
MTAWSGMAGALAFARTGWRPPGCHASHGGWPSARLPRTRGLAARSPCRARRAGRPCLPHVQGRADVPDARAGLAVGVPAAPGERRARVFSRHDS